LREPGRNSPRRARTRGNAAKNTSLSSARVGTPSENPPYRVDDALEKILESWRVQNAFCGEQIHSLANDS
jgi:hypothetical protein